MFSSSHWFLGTALSLGILFTCTSSSSSPTQQTDVAPSSSQPETPDRPRQTPSPQPETIDRPRQTPSPQPETPDRPLQTPSPQPISDCVGTAPTTPGTTLASQATPTPASSYSTTSNPAISVTAPVTHSAVSVPDPITHSATALTDSAPHASASVTDSATHSPTPIPSATVNPTSSATTHPTTVTVTAPIAPIPSASPATRCPPRPFTAQELESKAVSSSVRIFSMKDEIASGGTGVLIQRQGDTYTVITNQHVVSEPDRDYLIETHDGEQYAAQILATKASEQPEDVCFLTFQGQDRLYPILPLSTTSDPIALAQPVFAGGFPFTDDFVQSKEFRFTQGEVLRVLDRPFVGGYQLGYTNIIIPGMSGGPILNQKGELIGINALRSNPIFDNSYVYEDGTPVAPEELATIRRLSWGVPSTIAMRLLEPTPGNNKQVASPNPQPSITPAPKAVESCRK